MTTGSKNDAPSFAKWASEAKAKTFHRVPPLSPSLQDVDWRADENLLIDLPLTQKSREQSNWEARALDGFP